LADWPAPDTPGPTGTQSGFPHWIQSSGIGFNHFNPDREDDRATSNDKPAPQQGIVRDEKGQEQPADKERAQHVSRKDKGDDPPGQK